MAKVGRKKTSRRRVPRPTMTYVTNEERRELERHAERDAVTMSVWIRRLVVAELSRLAVRDQLDR